MQIEEKHQLIDDESVFKIEQLEGLNQEHIKTLNKTYHVLSIIGSQSSGKSTLLNALFGTTFEELNRSKRIGQTTKGIWYSVDVKHSMMIVDVEGSDSHERQERTKIQRRNSLFALAISHTLLINLWFQQIGLYKGSQQAILQIILELNLRLFGSEEPKNIIFVVRDYEKNIEDLQVLRKQLFSGVEQAWNDIPKPAGKEHIKLEDLFCLQAYFLPSKIDQPEQFQQQVNVLQAHLQKLASNQKIINSNVAMEDVPQYMKNLWETIQADKDINLPEEKILLSNMKCHEIKKQIYDIFEDQFRDQLERSERKMNVEFADNVKAILNKIFQRYDNQTSKHIKEEVEKVKEQFLGELQRKIELSYSFQVKHIVDQSLRQFTDQMNKLFIKEKSIEGIKLLLVQTLQKFNNLIQRVSYKSEWGIDQKIKFEKILETTYQSQKQRIIVDSLKDFDRSIKKQVQALVSNAFYDKEIFCNKFWDNINETFKDVEHKGKNSIVGLHNKLELKSSQGDNNKYITDHVQRAKSNAIEQLKVVIRMKCNDLQYYMMRHFSVDFNLDEQEIPRQWPNYKVQEIKQLYDKVKEKYLDMIPNFSEYQLNFEKATGKKQKTSYRATLKESSSSLNSRQILTSVEMIKLRKKIQTQMENQYQEALKKNKQVYVGAIPKWGWILFLIVAFDDIILWFKSPYLAIPITILLIVLAAVFFLGGRNLASSLVNNARRVVTNQFTSLTAQATTRMMRNQ